MFREQNWKQRSLIFGFVFCETKQERPNKNFKVLISIFYLNFLFVQFSQNQRIYIHLDVLRADSAIKLQKQKSNNAEPNFAEFLPLYVLLFSRIIAMYIMDQSQTRSIFIRNKIYTVLTIKITINILT